ncbi:DUF4014 family protein [Segatella asaccharophila]
MHQHPVEPIKRKRNPRDSTFKLIFFIYTFLIITQTIRPVFFILLKSSSPIGTHGHSQYHT